MNFFKRNFFFFFYYLLGFCGLYVPLKHLTFYMCRSGDVDLLPGQIFFFPHTRQIILFYIVLVPVLFFYFLHALYTIKKARTDKPLLHRSSWVLTISLLFNALCVFGAERGSVNPLIWLVLWMVLFWGTLLLFSSDRVRPSGVPRDSSKVHSWIVLEGSWIVRMRVALKRIVFKIIAELSIQKIAVLFLTLLMGCLIWAFSPLVFSTPKLPNDFLEIPEITLLDNANSTIGVENNDVIEKDHLFGEEFQLSGMHEQSASIGSPEKIAVYSLRHFEKRNQLELTLKFLTRGFIHHHNHVLAPVNELALGRPVSEIFSQYGWGSVWLVKTAMNFMPNGICYGNYIRLHFFGYYLYFGLFLALLFYLFKDIRIVTVLFSITVISVLKMEQYIWLGPGASPMRHFFDLPVIFFFMRHLTSQRFRYLYVTLLFCILGVIFNTQFGVILYLCIMAGLTFLLFWPTDLFDERHKKRLFPALVFGGACLLLSVWLCSHIGAKNIVSGYFFAGVLGFPIKESQLILLGAGILSGYLAWICIPEKVPVTNRIMSLVLMWYAQIMLLYYVRAASFYMFLPILPLVVLAVGYLVVQLADKMDQYVIYKRRWIFFSTLILVYVFFDTAEAYHNNFRKLFVRNFTQHVTYKWDMPQTHFISTMDPRYFSSSVELIQKYSSDTKGIYIISKYDRFLPFISERYSAMPFIDLEWFLITQKELDLVVGCIREKMPEYLFVDADIDQNFLQTQVIDPNSRYSDFREESLWRAQRLNNLKTVFDAVRNDYEKIESTYLLTVYHRKSGELNE